MGKLFTHYVPMLQNMVAASVMMLCSLEGVHRSWCHSDHVFYPPYELEGITERDQQPTNNRKQHSTLYLLCLPIIKLNTVKFNTAN